MISFFFRLQFRSLVRKYDCDMCFTPMIMSDSFVKSAKARDNDFTTNEGKVYYRITSYCFWQDNGFLA